MERYASKLVVVMGVTGTGKSAIAKALSTAFDWPFQEGDDLHGPANIEKMSHGIPLTDEDRWPWLERCHQWLRQHRETGGVLTCSALKRVYRDVLRQDLDLTFLYLWAPQAALEDRLKHRQHHFMPASLVPSQLRTLEPPSKDEPVIPVDASPPKDVVCRDAIDAVRTQLIGEVPPVLGS